MRDTGLVHKSVDSEDEFYRVTERVVLIDEATEVECKVEEVLHVMGQKVATHVLSVLELFLEDTDAELKFGFFVFGNED